MTPLVLAEAGTAAARELSVSGGMSLIDGSMITAIFTGMAAVISAIGTILWKNWRAAKAAGAGAGAEYVTRTECQGHRCAMEKRIDALGPALERIFTRLRENDEKDEARINSVHRRIDPLIEKIASTSAEVDMLKGSQKP